MSVQHVPHPQHLEQHLECSKCPIREAKRMTNHPRSQESLHPLNMSAFTIYFQLLYLSFIPPYLEGKGRLLYL